MDRKTVGLVAHSGKPGAAELTKLLSAGLREAGIDPRFDQATADLIGVGPGFAISELGASCDLILVLGGDGTLLHVTQQLGDRLCPLMGINLGSLGFLTCVSSNDHVEALRSVVSGEYHVSLRTMLQATVHRNGEAISEMTALNDAVVHRGQLSRLIKLEVRIDGDCLAQYSADGLIVATSTGSTAYSLSAGGPIIVPGSGVLVVSPICPHVLTNRSVVVPESAELEVYPLSEETDLHLTIDGQRQVGLRFGDHIVLRTAAKRLPLAMLPDGSFPALLRQKLKWTGTNV